MTKNNNRLIALIFDDPYKADEARAALNRMGGDGLLDIDETAVIVKKADGKVRVSQDVNIVEKDQHMGHIAGLVTAALTGTMPFIFAGTIAGKLIGKLKDDGITNKFLKSLEKELQPNTSVLVVCARSDPERRAQIEKRLAIFDPKILESDLPPELEAQLIVKCRRQHGRQQREPPARKSLAVVALERMPNFNSVHLTINDLNGH